MRYRFLLNYRLPENKLSRNISHSNWIPGYGASIERHSLHGVKRALREVNHQLGGLKIANVRNGRHVTVESAYHVSESVIKFDDHF